MIAFVWATCVATIHRSEGADGTAAWWLSYKIDGLNLDQISATVYYTLDIYESDVHREIYRLVRYKPGDHLDLTKQQKYDLAGADNLKIRRLSDGTVIQPETLYPQGGQVRVLPVLVTYESIDVGHGNPLSHIEPRPNSAGVHDKFTSTTNDMFKPDTAGTRSFRLCLTVKDKNGHSRTVCGVGSHDFGNPPEARHLVANGDWDEGALGSAEQDGVFLKPDWDKSCPCP